MDLKSVVVALIEGRDSVLFKRLAGDASNRSYWRAFLPDGSTVVCMKLAPEPLKSEEVVDGERPTTLPFLDVGRFLEAGGIPVPKVLHEDLDLGVLVLEDLGDETVEQALKASAPKLPLYRQAVRLMVAMEAHAERHKDPSCIAFRRRFGPGLLMWEFEHFYEWLLVKWTGKTPTPAARDVLTRFFNEVVTRLVGLPQGFVHRDFQSRNLMLKHGRLYLIDFQDALLGPFVYDLVALLRDSYVAFSDDEVLAIQEEFIQARREHDLFAPPLEGLKDAFALQTIQRKLKDAGRFVYIAEVKGNPKFLPNIPRSLTYAAEALRRFGEFSEAQGVLAEYLPDFFGKEGHST